LWLLECAPYVEKEHYSGFLIEYFLRFKDDDDDLRNITVIYKEILNNGRTPIYKKENIESLMKNISRVDPVSFEEIVETYGRRRQHFLRDAWEEYSRK